MTKRDHHFYDQPIYPDREKEYIKKLLLKYKNKPATEKLKKEIWDELQKEKYLGNIRIPFKVVLRKDTENKYPSFIQIILDTKV